MPNPTVPGNGQIVAYPRCQPWCVDQFRTEDHDEYCRREVGREVIEVTLDGDRYEITTTLVYARLPIGSPDEQEATANRDHRDVVQLYLSPYTEGLAPVAADLKPALARSLAAALIHAADLAEDLAR